MILLKKIFYDIILYLHKFKTFQIISNLYMNAYFINRGYCFDWDYLMNMSPNNLFKGENILISKFKDLKIKNCIDVGCNRGDFSKEILKNENTKVIAFEPLPGCQEYLKNIKYIYNTRFVYFECALSKKNGFTKIYFNDDKSELASLEKSTHNVSYLKDQNKNSLKVILKKLDSFIDHDNFNNIDFIKIDTEGHEMSVLEGGLDFIQKHKVKLIQIEFNWHHLFTKNTIFQFSEILDNYVVTQMNLINGKLVEIDKNHFFSNIFQLTNIIFIEKKFFKKNRDTLVY